MLKTVNTPGSTPFHQVQLGDSHFPSVGLTELSRVNQEFRLEENIRSETDFAGIVGQSSALRQVLQLVELVAASNATVLVLGETGTGKELIARAIHDRSQRREQSCVTLNCAAIPGSL